jgi:predicted O-methyltransferase YrrM
MNGTVSQKIARTLFNLMLHPQYITRCVAHNVLNGTPTIELGLPWFSYAAIDFLEKFTRPGMEVFEYGSGGSTLFFARRAKSVLAVEDNATWFRYVIRKLEQREVRNAMVKLCPFDIYHTEHFAETAYFRALPEGPFDIILVDGSEDNGSPIRPMCFERAEVRVKKGGIIVVDDSWRYPELRKRNRAHCCRTFESVGPCRPGVTSTDVFFY